MSDRPVSAAAAREQDDQPASAPVVVLHERDLEEPLEQAVRRVRVESPGARILVVGAAEAGLEDGGPLVLTPVEGAGRARVAPAADAPGRVEEAVQRVGRRWLQGEQMMQHWALEAKALALQLERALGKSDFGGLNEGIRRLIELNGWVETTVTETVHRAGQAARGMEPHNTAMLVRDAGREIHAAYPGVDLVLPALDDTPCVPCAAAATCRAFRNALELVARRIGGQGRVRIEIEEGNLFVLHRFRGDATSTKLSDVPEHLTAGLQRLVLDHLGGRIFRGRGESLAELVIALPTDYGELRLTGS